MPFGAQLAQATHAAGESSRLAPDLPDNTHAVVLHASGEPELLALEQTLCGLGIPHRAIREPDAPYLGAITAIGVQPMGRAVLRPLLSQLPLAR
jgi:hypothetical protein